jgi:hypothetical protein
MRVLWNVLLLGMVVGCGKKPEGLNTGECADLLDNDVDGLVDCFDPDCVSAGQCGIVTETACDDDIDNDADSQVDCNDSDCAAAAVCDDNPDDTEPLVDSACVTGTGPFVHGTAAGAVDIELEVTFDVAPAICDLFALSGSRDGCHCEMVYAGTGTLVRAADDESLYFGSFVRTSPACAEIAPGQSYSDSIWEGSDEDVWLYFDWSANGSELVTFVAHTLPDDCTVRGAAEAIERGVYVGAELDASWEAGNKRVIYSASYTQAVDVTSIDVVELATFQFR